MAIAYTPGTFRYVLKSDREKVKKAREKKETFEPTVFLLKALTAREMEDLEDSIQLGLAFGGKKGAPTKVTGKQDVKPGEKVNSFLRIGLKGWENFKDRDGNEVEFKEEKSTGMASWESINHVVPYRFELYNALEDGNTVEDDEAKNSQ